MVANGLIYDTQEAKQTVFAIVKENGTAVVKGPSDAAIVYGASTQDSAVFFVGATQVGRDGTKAVNRTDIVGTQLQRVSEGSTQRSLSLDVLVVRPATLGDKTIQFFGTGLVVHGRDADSTTGKKQYAITPRGLDAMLASTNTYTIRVWQDCPLDAYENANVLLATQITDYEFCHLSSASESNPGGGDVTYSITFEAEQVSFPATTGALPT